MSTGILIFLGIFLFGALAIIGYFITIYNGLISLKENIKKSWSNIDVILKQRHDELPKLISVCESYSEFETGILDRLMKAREKYFKAKGVTKKSEASNEVTAALQGIFALAESYPDLKTNKNFMQLQERISHLEETLADRREFYNDTVSTTTIFGSNRFQTSSWQACSAIKTKKCSRSAKKSARMSKSISRSPSLPKGLNPGLRNNSDVIMSRIPTKDLQAIIALIGLYSFFSRFSVLPA